MGPLSDSDFYNSQPNMDFQWILVAWLGGLIIFILLKKPINK